jgi:endonuclease YncB( thermonuclease family)
MKMLLAFMAAFLVFTSCAYAECVPDVFSGKVLRVVDGDTVDVQISQRKQIRVRLVEIDAPEHDQPYGAQAKAMLSDLVLDKTVSVVVTDPKPDKYKRVLGRIFVTDVNKSLVADGGAWAYREYLCDKALLKDEKSAKKAKRGLWGLPDAKPAPPWEWRHRKHD